jgi:hypothetical protein
LEIACTSFFVIESDGFHTFVGRSCSVRDG